MNKSEKTTVNVTQSTMSNLVGMWAAIWNGDELKNKVFICGKADEKYYIVQVLGALTGQPNIAKLVTVEQMKEENWDFFPTKEIAQEVLGDYMDKGIRRYKFEI